MISEQAYRLAVICNQPIISDYFLLFPLISLSFFTIYNQILNHIFFINPFKSEINQYQCKLLDLFPKIAKANVPFITVQISVNSMIFLNGFIPFTSSQFCILLSDLIYTLLGVAEEWL